jgi:hypothetical protein
MKNIYYNNKILILSALILYLASSCTPGSCFEETNAFLKAGFANSENGKITSPDSLTLYGSGMQDKKLYSRALKVNTVLIPLNSSAPGSVFIIRINGITDTLNIWYTSYPHLISKECGYTFFHNIDSLKHTTNYIEDIVIRNRTISTFDGENIRIYF